jgi:hypothetical protein
MLNARRHRIINTIIFHIGEIAHRHRCLIHVARHSPPTKYHHPLSAAPHMYHHMLQV